MEELEAQILETWRIHQRITLFLLDEIPDGALTATLSSRGGRDIARQLAHIHAVRLSRIDSFIRKWKIEPIHLDSKESPERAMLREALAQSGELTERAIAESLENGGKFPGFPRGLVPMIGYSISHEAHHRGSILLTMKQSGFKIPDSLKWQIWDWNKM